MTEQSIQNTESNRDGKRKSDSVGWVVALVLIVALCVLGLALVMGWIRLW